jgi:hypothetical protein
MLLLNGCLPSLLRLVRPCVHGIGNHAGVLPCSLLACVWPMCHRGWRVTAKITSGTVGDLGHGSRLVDACHGRVAGVGAHARYEGTIVSLLCRSVWDTCCVAASLRVLVQEDFAYVHPMKKEALRIQQRLAALTHPQPSRTTIPSSTVATLGQTYPIDLEFVQARVGVWVPDPDFYTAAAMQYPADYSERVDAAIAGVIASSEAVVTADTSSEGRVWIRKPQWELASAVLGQQLRRASVDSVAPPKAAATSVSSTFAGWIGKATPSEDHNATAPTAAGVGRKAGQPGYRAGWHAATGKRDDTATMAPQQ